MSGNFIFASVFEIIIAAFIIWGVFHEESLARWEARLFTRIRRMARTLRRRHRDRRYSTAHRHIRQRLAS